MISRIEQPIAHERSNGAPIFIKRKSKNKCCGYWRKIHKA